jgi:hypothetical protein
MSKTIAEQIAALETRINADTEKLANLKRSQAAQAALDSIAPGSVIRFVFGRKETRGEYSGEVRSIIDTEKGKVIRVIKGEGADEEIVSIKPSDILAVGEEVQEAEAERSTAVPEAMAAPYGETSGASADPLASLI